MIILAPSQNIVEVLFIPSNQNGYRYSMTPSEKYNYSIFVGSGPDYESISGSELAPYIAVMQSTAPHYAVTPEPAAINVTEQYSPFVFKVQHSYLAPGTIHDVQVQMVAASEADFGDYPLNVFTSRGAPPGGPSSTGPLAPICHIWGSQPLLISYFPGSPNCPAPLPALRPSTLVPGVTPNVASPAPPSPTAPAGAPAASR